jgi:hypothetical protein
VDVRERKAGEDRHRDDARIALHLVGEIVEAAHGPPGGQLARDRRQEPRLAKGDRGAQSPGGDIREAVRSFEPALRHVDVRVGLVAVEERGVAHHVLCDVGVEVERHADGNRGTDHLAHGAEEIAFAVVRALDDHGAVQVEQHAVERAGGSKIRADAGLRVLVEGPCHPSRGRGPRGKRWQQREPACGGAVDHSAEARPGPAIGFEDLAAVAQLAGLELPPVRRDGAEGVRLVRQHRDENAHGTSPGCDGAMNVRGDARHSVMAGVEGFKRTSRRTR